MWGWHLQFQFLTKSPARKGKMLRVLPIPMGSYFLIYRWVPLFKHPIKGKRVSSETHLSQGQGLSSSTSQMLKSKPSHQDWQPSSASHQLTCFLLSFLFLAYFPKPGIFFSFLSYTFRIMCVRCYSTFLSVQNFRSFTLPHFVNQKTILQFFKGFTASHYGKADRDY